MKPIPSPVQIQTTPRQVTSAALAGKTVTIGGGTETRNVNQLQAFNRGKEAAFNEALDACKKAFDCVAAEIQFNIRASVQSTVDDARMDLTKKIAAAHDKLDEKLNKLHGMVEHLMSHSSAGLNDGQGKVNHDLFTNKFADVLSQLDSVQCQLNEVQKKSDIDDIAQHLSAHLDLPKNLEVQGQSFLSKCEDLHVQTEAQTREIATGVAAVRTRLNEPSVIDWSSMRQENDRLQAMMTEDFETTIQEIGRIQRGLNLDYLQARSVSRKPTAHQLQAAEHGDDACVTTKRLSFHQDTTLEYFRPEHDHPHEKPASSRDAGSKKTVVRRVREFWAQTENDAQDEASQTDPEMTRGPKKKPVAPPRPKPEPKDNKGGMADADAMREKARKALIQSPYEVSDFYHKSGYFQAIARSSIFDNVTVAVVCFNALWIAIDVDNNDAAVLTEADAVFQVAENMFCSYFVFELIVRFMAFARKLHALKDHWFVFDTLLVFNMVLETWILPLVMLTMSSSENKHLDVSMLRIFRLVKLLRLSRISRLLRAVPELIIIVKGIKFAARSVVIFFVIWLLTIYIFAVVLRQLTDKTPVGEQYFKSVLDSMNTLLLNGLLADYAPVLHAMGSGSPLIWLVMLAFVLLASITIMYMLLGVLVDVVGVISAAEKEGMTVKYVASKLRAKMEALGQNVDAEITKFEFQKLLVEPDVCQVLASVSVDVVVLVDTLDMIYEDLEKTGRGMTFEKMIDIMLNGRGGNAATVRDTKEILRLTKSIVKAHVGEVYTKISQEFSVVHANINALREDQDQDHDGLGLAQHEDADSEHGDEAAANDELE
eukprot:TRINITY_DN36813_c0_g2_i1.p1 TRINITY_DN36813_c0_g2~~TRINITY_DN36813_c0_g2_i1.p1  ORF type:complete len:834 (-),score=172.27 TRINITY_DN36813_c0_g2_i1:200-2671(-)